MSDTFEDIKSNEDPLLGLLYAAILNVSDQAEYLVSASIYLSELEPITSTIKTKTYTPTINERRNLSDIEKVDDLHSKLKTIRKYFSSLSLDYKNKPTNTLKNFFSLAEIKEIKTITQIANQNVGNIVTAQKHWKEIPKEDIFVKQTLGQAIKQCIESYRTASELIEKYNTLVTQKDISDRKLPSLILP